MTNYSPNTCLITGCGGFIGSYMAELMVQKGYNVSGTVYENRKNVKHLADTINLIRLDIQNSGKIDELISNIKPSLIIHLAAQSNVPDSLSHPDATIQTNVLGTLSILESVRRHSLSTSIVVAGSSAEYGIPQTKGALISESSLFFPSTPYAVSKASIDLMSYMYAQSHGLRVTCARLFATIGPRKIGDAVSDFAKGIIRIEKGEDTKVKVGNLSSVRDFSDVRDSARALEIIASKGLPGEAYNIGSGQGQSLDDIMSPLIKISGIPVQVEVDQERLRPVDDHILVSDNSKLRGLGWKPEFTLEQTLSDTLDYWRSMHTDSKEGHHV